MSPVRPERRDSRRFSRRIFGERLGRDEAAQALRENVEESAVMDERMTELAATLLPIRE